MRSIKINSSNLLLVCGILLLTVPTNSHAQLTPKYSQYIMNEFLINPATAGADAMTTVNLTGRKEWLGFGDDVPTPQTYSASFQTRFLKKSIGMKSGIFGKRLAKGTKGRVGMGISFVSDYNGAIQRTGISATYAYHITMSQSQLSFGLTASIFETRIRSQYLNFKDNNEEPLMSLANNAYWIPDFAAGINYIDRNFHIGFSASQLLESAFILGNSGVNWQNPDFHYKRNYNLISSYKHEFKSGSNWEYEPSVLVKMYDPVYFTPAYNGPQVQADIMLRLICQRSYWFGIAYRTSKEYVALLGIRYENLFFGYSFDYGNNGIIRYSYGSHELSISLKLGDTRRRLPWMERY